MPCDYNIVGFDIQFNVETNELLDTDNFVISFNFGIDIKIVSYDDDMFPATFTITQNYVDVEINTLLFCAGCFNSYIIGTLNETVVGVLHINKFQ